MLNRLLPTAPVHTPPPRPVTTELESLLERLLSGALAPMPAPPSQTGITEMETLLQRLLPETPPASRSRPVLARRDWTAVMCFSCGKSGYRVSRCPDLNITFPYMLPGWSAEKVGTSYIMISPRMAAERWLIRGGGSTARISNELRPLDPGGGAQLAASRVKMCVPPMVTYDSGGSCEEHGK